MKFQIKKMGHLRLFKKAYQFQFKICIFEKKIQPNQKSKKSRVPSPQNLARTFFIRNQMSLFLSPIS